jgi:hypothetical protein
VLFTALNWTISVFEREELESSGGWEGGLLISRGTVALLLLLHAQNWRTAMSTLFTVLQDTECCKKSRRWFCWKCGELRQRPTEELEARCVSFYTG